MADWSERWLETRKVRGLVSVRDDRFRLSTHILPVIGALPMALVTRAHLEDLVERLDAKSRAGTISWKTARHIWGLTTKMFHDATNAKNRSLRMRDTNPALGVAPPDRGVRKAKTYLYPSEFLALVTCERVPLRWARIFTLSSYLYVRAGELAGLEWEDVDLAHASVNVHRSLDLDAGHEKPTKGKASRRVPIHPSLMPLLKRMHAEAGGRGRVVKMPPREDLPRRLRTYLKWAGVTRAELFANDATRKQLTFHDLRGTGITWLAIAGTEPLKIKTWAGHETFSTTEIYIREAENVRPGIGQPFPPLPPQVLGPALNRPRESSCGTAVTKAERPSHGDLGAILTSLLATPAGIEPALPA